MGPTTRDLEMNRFTLGGDDDDLEEVRLLESYEDTKATTQRIQLRVNGMTCSACSTSVESALVALPAVRSAAVALLQNRADVSFDPRLAQVHAHSLSLCVCVRARSVADLTE